MAKRKVVQTEEIETMNEAVVELDGPVGVSETESPESVEQSEDFYATFDFADYIHLVPVEMKGDLEDIFNEHKRGWKRLASLMYRLRVQVPRLDKISHKYETSKQTVTSIISDIESYLGSMGTRNVNPATRVRSGLRLLLADCSDEVLELKAEQNSVDYNSFMSHGDKEGLIEAIIDNIVDVPTSETNQEDGQLTLV